MTQPWSDRLRGRGPRPAEPVDPKVDLHDPAQRRELTAHPWTLPLIAAGGMIGASARYALELLWPPSITAVPYATLVTNLSGCLLVGVVMVAVTETGQRHPLWRPFLAVGILGGYTTFSTYTVQVQQAVDAADPRLALGYLAGTVAGALLAVTIGTITTRALLRPNGRHRPTPGPGPPNPTLAPSNPDHGNDA